MNELEWWVILPKETRSGPELFHNIFNSVRFRGALMDMKSRSRRDPKLSIEEELRRALAYAYRAKTEYEIEVHALFNKHEHKIDIYTQVMANYEAFYNYIRENWKHIPAKSYRQQAKEDEIYG